MSIFLVLIIAVLAWKITNALIIAHEKRVETRDDKDREFLANYLHEKGHSLNDNFRARRICQRLNIKGVF